jgi:GNAT superfamily N-acetyltransferase
VTTISVRGAEEDDAPIIAELARENHFEASMDHPEPNNEDVKNILSMAGEIDSATVLVAEADDRPVGYLMGFAIEPAYSQEMMAAVDKLFVSKAHRNSSAASRLLKEFEDWCKKREVKIILSGVNSGIDIERKRTWFERMGYKFIGYNFAKQVSKVTEQ